MSNLFVQEDDDDLPSQNQPQQQHTNERGTPLSDDSEDDPIITEVPIILKNTPSLNHDLYALQYANRSKDRPITGSNRVVETRMKPLSNLIEVDIPVDTSKFYDVSKSEEWGGVERQTLQGVLLDLDGYFVGKVQDGKLVLIPLNGVSQLRTSLKHIDREFNDKKEMARLESNANKNAAGQNDIQVVQMSVRNSAENAPRLAGALLARKNVDEEQFTILKWNDLTDEATKQLKGQLTQLENGVTVELEPLTTKEEYIDLLVKETISF